jgi:hypothetical protein
MVTSVIHGCGWIQNILSLQFSSSEACLLQDREQGTHKDHARTMFKVITTSVTGTEDKVGSLTVQYHHCLYESDQHVMTNDLITTHYVRQEGTTVAIQWWTITGTLKFICVHWNDLYLDLVHPLPFSVGFQNIILHWKIDDEQSAKKEDHFSKSYTIIRDLKCWIHLCHFMKAAGDDNTEHVWPVRDLSPHHYKQILDSWFFIMWQVDMIQSHQKMNADEDEYINDSTKIWTLCTK